MLCCSNFLVRILEKRRKKDSGALSWGFRLWNLILPLIMVRTNLWEHYLIYSATRYTFNHYLNKIFIIEGGRDARHWDILVSVVDINWCNWIGNMTIVIKEVSSLRGESTSGCDIMWLSIIEVTIVHRWGAINVHRV